MLEKKEQKGRESIWSVSRETKGLYFIIFIALVLIGAGLVTYQEVHLNKADGILVTALETWAGVGRLVIASVAGSLVVTEVWRNGMVLAERLEEWFAKRREKQIATAVAKGVAEGVTKAVAEEVTKAKEKAREEARQEARAEISLLWQAWNERRLEAERLGRSFDEPPPSIQGNSS